MIGRKTTVSLSLLGTLCLCAFTAQSALAVPGWTTNENTTAYECESKAGAQDFSDAHCDSPVKAGTGSFGHVAISTLGSPAITVTNQTTKNKTTEPTDTVLQAISKGETVNIAVKEVHGIGSIKNSAPELKHEVEGTVTLEYRTIVVNEPLNCSAKEPVEFTTKFKGVKTAGGEMGLEFTPEKGVLLTIELLGGKCPQAGTKLELKGSAVATGGAGAMAKASGATGVFSSGNQSLEVSGLGAILTGTITTRLSGLGNPIGLTTVT
jgi:hypothetical protein